MYTLKIISGVGVDVKSWQFFLFLLLCVVLCAAIFVNIINVNSQPPMVAEERNAGTGKKVKRRVILWSKVVWLFIWRLFVQIGIWLVLAVKGVWSTVVRVYVWGKRNLRELIPVASVPVQEEAALESEYDAEAIPRQITPTDELPQLSDELDELCKKGLSEIKQHIPQWSKVSEVQAMLLMERAIHHHCLHLADQITALIIERRLQDEEFCKAARVKAYQRHPEAEALDKRPVSITLLGGSTITVLTTYVVYRPCRHTRKGRPRGVGKRGKGGAGLYPALYELGFRDRVSPALQTTVARTATEVASYQIASEMLHDRGIPISYKRVRKITLALGARAFLTRNAKLQQQREGTLPTNDQWAGKRIAIAVDGGRLRTRIFRRGRPRASGWRRFSTPWREPKMLTIYEIDEKGKKIGKPIYDGTLGEWQALLLLLLMHLQQTGADRAREIVFLGDGGDWIWSLQNELFATLPGQRKQDVLDFYHASGYLWEMIDKATSWCEGRKREWFKEHRRLLKKGRVDRLLSSLHNLLLQHRGRRRKRINNAIDYFTEHRHRMRYQIFKACGIPTGSGAIESALRQVVNLRLKSAGSFWLPKNAENMLVLRCALKSGRWDEMVQEVLGENFMYSHPQATAA